MGRLKSYAGISRVPFLLLPVVLVALGTGAAAWDTDRINPARAFLALFGLLSLHVGVNVINESSDAKRGIDRETSPTPFSGGSGTVPSGKVSVREAALFGFTATVIGLFVGLWFLWILGWVMLPLIILAAVLVIGYTDFFARIGLGEIAAGLGLGALPVIGSALVQNGTHSATATAAGIVSFMLTFNLLLLNEFPDRKADSRGGRKNLVIMIGPEKAALVWLGVALGVPALILLLGISGVLPWPCLIAAVPGVLLKQAMEWAREKVRVQSTPPLPVLGANVYWNLATHALLSAGLFVAWGTR